MKYKHLGRTYCDWPKHPVYLRSSICRLQVPVSSLDWSPDERDFGSEVHLRLYRSPSNTRTGVEHNKWFCTYRD